MSEKRNALIDITRVIAAVGIILSHVDMTSYGAVGTLFGQFLSARFSLMFFLATIGFFVEKSYQAKKNPISKRVVSLTRVYGIWSLVYLILSFVMLVLIQKMPLGQYCLSRVKGFLFTGSYYHFWFYPAVIYALLLIGAAKKLLGNHAFRFLVPLAAVLYAVGLLGTGYLPIGRQIPVLRALYRLNDFDAVMHLFLLGFPSVVFGMAAADIKKSPSAKILPLAAVMYVFECILLCLILGWREDPQMLVTAPLFTILFIIRASDSAFTLRKINPSLLRIVSAGMYNIHPLILAAFSLVLPALDGIAAFILCTVFSVLFGVSLCLLRKNRLIALLI